MTNTISLSTVTRRALMAVSVATMALSIGPAMAQDAPSEIHFLIPGGAGGGWDGTARGVGEALMGSELVENASFENMSGGGGGVAIAHLIETADQQGGTLMVNSTPIVIRSLTGVFPQSFRDLTPIASVVADYAALVASPDSGIETWQDAVAAFEADPTSIRLAGGSTRGGMDHMVGEIAFTTAGAEVGLVNYIAYDAGGDALTGLLSGETELLSTGVSEVVGAHNNGQVRILAITAPERLDAIPDVPTLVELGHDGAVFANWRGFFGSPSLTDEEADAYAALLGEVMETEAWEEVRARLALENFYQPRGEFVEFLESNEAQMGELMRSLGVM